MPGLEAEGATPPRITDVLSLIDQMFSTGHVPGGEWQESQLRDVRSLLERGVFRVLDWPYDHRKAVGVPLHLKSWVKQLIDETRDGSSHYTIVSTNYDIAFEREVYRQLGFGR